MNYLMFPRSNLFLLWLTCSNVTPNRATGGGPAFLLLSGGSSVVSVDPLSLLSAAWITLRFLTGERVHTLGIVGSR